MKHFTKLTVVLLCLFSLLAGCKKPIETATFSGVVLRVNERSIIVQPFEGEEILDQVSVSTNIDDETELPELQVGDNVCVTWSGGILETAPANLETVHAIDIIEK